MIEQQLIWLPVSHELTSQTFPCSFGILKVLNMMMAMLHALYYEQYKRMCYLHTISLDVVWTDNNMENF